jgi:K+-sensing histidine kinase KdpD
MNVLIAEDRGASALPSLRRRWQRPSLGYLVAVLGQVVAVSFTLYLRAMWPRGFPYQGVLPLVVVIAVALRWDFGASVLATLLGAALVDYYVLPPYATWSREPAQMGAVLAFMAIGLTIGLLGRRAQRARLHAAAAAAREHDLWEKAERTAGRIARLQAVTATLAGALTPEDVADAIIEQGLAALGATTGAVVVLSDDATTLRTLRLVGYPPEVAAGWREFPVDTSILLADAVRAREVLTLETAQERRTRYPHLAPITDASRAGANVAIPVIMGDRATGAIGLSFPTERHFDAEDLAFMRTLADLCAQALDRARLYELERQAHRCAAAAVRERDTFLSVAAHELKTPLTSLRAFAQLLLGVPGQGGPLDLAQTQRALRQIEGQTGKLSRLVDQLLDVARLETGHLALDCRETDLTALVAEVAAAARVQTDRHTVIVEAPRSVPAWVDPLRLEQVLTNLVNNALKYSPQGGPIALTLAVDPGGASVRLAVCDRGLGIPTERRAHIFDRFYRAHADHHRSGLGLGLYISQQIVALHGGRLEAEFPEDGGARFIVTLPRGQGAGGADDG